MTLEEVRTYEKDYLTPKQVASVLDMNPQSIREQAKKGTLPFPALPSGNRWKIPRIAFLKYMGLEVAS